MSVEPSKDPERRFLDALGYQFRDRRLFLQAVTHRSYLNEVDPALGSEPIRDNERLEFLGDAVLDLVVSTELMARFPEAREGELSRMRATLVHEGGLAALARRVDLGPVLRLGRGEDLSGGRDRDSLLADALEAVIAAVFLDGGFEQAREVLVPLLEMDEGERLSARDPKTELQQRVQAARKVAPSYRLARVEGPMQAQVFVAEVLLEDRVLGVGQGRSKKLAEQRAAAAVLARVEAEGLDDALLGTDRP